MRVDGEVVRQRYDALHGRQQLLAGITAIYN